MAKQKKKAIKMGTEFPREDMKFPRQYTDAWTTCTRCKVQNSAFSEKMHYIDGFPFCSDCYLEVKESYINKDGE